MIKELLKPRLISKQIMTDNHISLKVQPLERGFGTTIGFAFKNIMLQGLRGSALSQIIVKTDEVLCTNYNDYVATHESLQDIILNLRAITFSLKSQYKSARASLKITNNPRDIMASDLLLEEGLSIVNPEIKICTYKGISSLEIICIIENNVGTRVVEQNWQQDGFHVDAFFSPVTSCDYKVDAARVGRNTDFNRLSLDIKTNGAMSAVEALSSTVWNLYDQIQDLLIEGTPTLVAEEKRSIDSFLLKDVSILELSSRSLNCLRNEGLYTLKDLLEKSEEDLMKTPNFGKKSLLEIKEKLATYGYSLRE